MRLPRRGETIRLQATDERETSLRGRALRGWAGWVHRWLGPGAPWVQRHVACCSRCHSRLAPVGRVNLALSIIRSQPHRLDLLMRANSGAMRMLNHTLRRQAKVLKLEQSRPEPSWIERCRRYQGSVANVAACVAVLLLSRAGLLRSFQTVRTQGLEVMKQYYAAQAGEDLAGEIFASSPPESGSQAGGT